MKKLLSTVAAILAATAISLAASLTPISGPQDPSQLNATLNQLQRNIATGVNGLIWATTTTVASSATTAEQTLYTQPIPAGTLALQGQSLRLRCAGITAQNTNSKTIKLYYGTTVLTSPVITASGSNWELDLLVTYGASATASRYVGRGSHGAGASASAMTPIVSANATDDLSTALNGKCTTTQSSATAADTSLLEMIVEQVK